MELAHTGDSIEKPEYRAAKGGSECLLYTLLRWFEEEKVTTSDDSGVGLVRINKLTGKVDGKVVLDDKKPDYLFDEIENMLFYKDGNKKLVAYNFNK